MIATPVRNRAHDGSRGSRTTSPQESIDRSATAHEPTSKQNIPTLPEGKNLARFLDAFLDGSFSIPSICDEFELTVFEVLALLESTEVQNALNALKAIAKIRQDSIAAQARVTAIHRLSELATYAHTADAVEARAFETARKSAAQIIRTTSPEHRVPKANRKAIPPRHAQQDQQPDKPTSQSARTERNNELCACAQGLSICRAVGSEFPRIRSRATDLALEVSAVGHSKNTDLQSKVSGTITAGSELRRTEEVGSEIRPTKNAVRRTSESRPT